MKFYVKLKLKPHPFYYMAGLYYSAWNWSSNGKFKTYKSILEASLFQLNAVLCKSISYLILNTVLV